MARLFLSVFAVTFLAELPDKTALATVVLASRRHPMAVFWGTAAAFLIQSLVAVLFGSVLSRVPPALIHAGAGLLFLGMAAAMWRGDESGEGELHLAPEAAAEHFWTAAKVSFATTFLAEWGDLTQLSTAAFTAKYKSPVVIFAAATSALWAATALMVAIGHSSRRHIHPGKLKRAAAAVFALVGAFLLLGGRR